MKFWRRSGAVVAAVALAMGVLVACDGGTACASELTAVNVVARGGGGSFGGSSGGSRSSGGSFSGGSRSSGSSSTGSRSSSSSSGSKSSSSGSKPSTRPPTRNSSGTKTRPPTRTPSNRPASKTPKSISRAPRGIAKGVKAPTSKTRFSTTYKSKVTVNNRTVTRVYVYHQPSYYSGAEFLALDLALRRADPYYPANYYDPFSPWFHHPVLIANTCQPQAPPPPGEKPDQPPVNVTINESRPPESTTTTAPAPTTSTTVAR